MQIQSMSICSQNKRFPFQGQSCLVVALPQRLETLTCSCLGCRVSSHLLRHRNHHLGAVLDWLFPRALLSMVPMARLPLLSQALGLWVSFWVTWTSTFAPDMLNTACLWGRWPFNLMPLCHCKSVQGAEAGGWLWAPSLSLSLSAKMGQWPHYR